jgi:hypothetical protein
VARAWLRRQASNAYDSNGNVIGTFTTGGIYYANLRANWLNDVLASRSGWAFPGPDERVFLENGDDGASMTDDGVHPNALGEYRSAQEWRRCIGFE